MTKTKSTRSSLITSAVALLLCFTMLLGTTWAWFTDSAISVGNKIVSGNLKLDLEVLDEATKQWRSIKTSKAPLFDYDRWEPGYTDVTVLKIENEGDLAIKWVAKFVSEYPLSSLADVIDVYVLPSDVEIGYTSDRALDGYKKVGTVKQFINGIEETTKGVLYPENSTDGVSVSYLGIALKMQESAGNEYQNMSLGGAFDIQILATQYSYENDYFGNTYDENSQYPVLATQIKTLSEGASAIDFDLSHNSESIAMLSVPANAIADPTKPVTITFTDMDPADTIVVGENTKAVAYDIEVSNLKENLAEDQLITVTLNMPSALPAAQVYHNGALIADAVYDEVSGTITFKTASFSPYAITWKERTASTIEELRDCITGDDDVYIRLTGDIVIDSNEGTEGFNGSKDHMAVSSVQNYAYYNGVNILGKNVAIDLNGHDIVASGNVGAIFFVMPESSLNIVDTVGGGVITANTACYVVWAPYDEPSFCDIYGGIFVAHSYAGMETYTNRAIVYAGEGGTINIYGGYYLYDNESYTDKNGVTYENVNNGAFNVMDSTKTQRITIYDGVMLINEHFRQDGYNTNNKNADHDSIFLAEHCDLVKISQAITIDGKTYGTWYQVQTAQPTKFETVFENTDKYIYRVGNGNPVALGSLFKTENAVSANATITVTVTALNNSGVSHTYTANATDWAKGTIKFTGIGIAKITINGYELIVEVVDAVNATTATSATKNNVVLLNDVGLHTIEVSNGYTLYGNGFKMEAKSDVMYDTMGVGFVTLKNGTLDNVQIICPNFSYSIVYNNQIQSAENTAKPSDSSNDARGNVRSAVMVDGNSYIVNSYIHGGRAAIFFRSGNLLIDGSTISGGATANIHTMSAQSLTLHNATLIQKPFKANVNDTSKTIMGFSVLLECGESGNATPVILEGTLIQDAWINENYKQYAPSAASSIISVALSKTDYLHDLDGDGTKESLNLGFTYIPQSTGGSTNANVTDNRTNKDSVPYAAVDVGNVLASAKVFSYKNTNGTSADFTTDGAFTPSVQGTTAPTVSFTDTNADRVFETKFDTSDNRWESSLTVNLDNGDYTFNFDTLLLQKNGTELTYTVKTESGTAVDTSTAISLTMSGVTDYVLTATDGDGNTHTVYFTLTATKTSIPEPELYEKNYADPLLVVKAKNSDWTVGIPALEGIKIKYYTSANNAVTLDLSSLTPTSIGKQNGTNNFWEYSNGYKLKVTSGYIHEGKQVYGMPVVVDNNGTKQMYFTLSSTTGYVSTSTTARTVKLTYEFTDPNGKTLTFSNTWNLTYADYKDKAQYSYSDFVNGKMTDLLSGGSSGGCVTPDTLITLANGTQVRVDSLTGNEELLVWNMETGKLDKAPIMFIDSDPAEKLNVVKLKFSDGTEVKVIYEHGFWDYELNKYVYLDENAADCIGHTFAKQNGDKLEKVQLIDVVIEEDVTMAWSPVTVGHLCYFVNGMLSMPGGVGGLFNIFDVDPDTMTYDYEAIQRDIETYGLYTYEELNAICPLSEEMFDAAGGAYLKISIGKCNLTEDELIAMINRYSKYI